MKKLFFFLAVTTVSLNAIVCDSFGDFQQYNGHYYAYISENVSFDVAKNIAINNGGYLAIPDTQGENDFIKNLIGGNNIAWIGIYDPSYMENYCYDSLNCSFSDARFKTIKNTNLSYKSWASYQPDNLVDSFDIVDGKNMVSPLGEHWVGISGSNGKWFDFGNHRKDYNNPIKYRAIIEFDTKPTCYLTDDANSELPSELICNTKVYDSSIDTVTQGETYQCLSDIYGTDYCPSTLAPAGEYWDYENGYSVSHTSIVTDYTNSVYTERTGTVRDYANGTSEPHTSTTTNYSNGTSGSYTGSVVDYVAGTSESLPQEEKTMHLYLSSGNTYDGHSGWQLFGATDCGSGNVNDSAFKSCIGNAGGSRTICGGQVTAPSTIDTADGFSCTLQSTTFTEWCGGSGKDGTYGKYKCTKNIPDGKNMYLYLSSGNTYDGHSGWQLFGATDCGSGNVNDSAFKSCIGNAGGSKSNCGGQVTAPSTLSTPNGDDCSIVETSGVEWCGGDGNDGTYAKYWCYNPIKKVVCPSTYSDNGTNCQKTVNYNYYSYGCPSGYSPTNSGFTTYTKTDTDTNANNEATLDDAVNSSTPPVNNCVQTLTATAYQYICGTGYTVVNGGLTSCPTGTSGACNSSTSPTSNCYKDISYKYYEYGCPSGYNTDNHGLTTCPKTDPNNQQNNEATLDDACNSPTAPNGNCQKPVTYSYYEYLCSNSTNEQGINYSATNTGMATCTKSDTSTTTDTTSTLDDACNSATPPANNCARQGFSCNSDVRKPAYVNNQWQCSPFPCLGENNFESLDGSLGSQDKENDGWSENGDCTGEIYIFNGKSNRCRSSDKLLGLTGGGCCDKDKVALGLVACKSEEKLLAKRRQKDFCHYVGTFCSKKVKLGFVKACVQNSDSFCCFSSKLARIMIEQGRLQLKESISWGSSDNPNCRGFTPDEFAKIDFTKVDLSEFVSDVQNNVTDSVSSNISNYIKDKVTNFYQN